MSSSQRGPTGAPRPPPDDAASLPLPIRELPNGASFSRIHRISNAPIFFSPGIGKPPAGRFDSATGTFGVLYCAETFAGAFIETVLRNPARRLIGMAEIESRSLAVIGTSRTTNFVDLQGDGLQQLGLDGSIFTGPYENCGLWTDALFHHPKCPDGILYRSRHDPGQTCIALFERADLGLTLASDSVPLTMLLAEIGELLRRYGKALDVSGINARSHYPRHVRTSCRRNLPRSVSPALDADVLAPRPLPPGHWPAPVARWHPSSTMPSANTILREDAG